MNLDDALFQRIANSEVFGKLDLAIREQLVVNARKRMLKKNEIICFQGDTSKFVLLIHSGGLKSFISAINGREHVISTWDAGEEFWAHTIFDEDPMPSTLQALENKTIIYQWCGIYLYDIILKNTEATKALIRRQTQLIRKRREKIYNLAFNPVASRLAKLILDKYSETNTITVQRDLTLEEMASMVATSPEVVCRTLYQFQSDGLLTINRASFILNDRETMEKMILKD
ncbi:MAG TPA: Crp/Fnr family transcriptional regulator [Anaerolineales bacterium]|nr:Crp/Fnr family transcriptional regulator [Anaerolineales bacterium]